MKVLIACEESQRVCIAFREKGHEAYSCDIIKCSGGHPEWHIQGDVTDILNGNVVFSTCDDKIHYIEKWDLIIAHPPCTYLSNAGARWLYPNGILNFERYEKGLSAKNFFMEIFNADCEKIAVENPIPSKVYEMPECSQIIQPYEYGEPWSKRTCLWLKGLPLLKPTKIVTEYIPFCTSGSYTYTHNSKYSGASRKGGSSISRSKTFIGIAKAMAEQWG